MKNLTLTALLLTLALSGCAMQEYRWQKGNLDSVSVYRDNMECRKFAMQQVDMMGLKNNAFNELSIAPREAECMRNLGYSSVPVPKAGNAGVR
jgi:hypothetical protein